MDSQYTGNGKQAKHVYFSTSVVYYLLRVTAENLFN